MRPVKQASLSKRHAAESTSPTCDSGPQAASFTSEARHAFGTVLLRESGLPMKSGSLRCMWAIPIPHVPCGPSTVFKDTKQVQPQAGIQRWTLPSGNLHRYPGTLFHLPSLCALLLPESVFSRRRHKCVSLCSVPLRPSTQLVQHVLPWFIHLL